MTRKRDKIDQALGERIRMYRVKVGMSQTALAQAIGLTFQQVQKYESGTNAVASSRVMELCQCLKIKPNDLFGVGASEPAAGLSSWAYRCAFIVDELSPKHKKVALALIELLEGLK